ncbi:MAG: hypothetical protein KC435_07000 [Thermomicrobiales bacterium]|nr:hypothetical protein [Thermomicrobiales bacterium]
MPQTTDIILNNYGYMIDPGSPSSPGYKRLQEGFPEGRTDRTTITDFIGGQHRHLQLEKDKLGDSLAIGPALGSQGVTPWPYQRSTSISAMAALDKPNRDTAIPFAIVRNRLYFAVGKSLYAGVSTDGVGAVTSTSLVKTYPDVITDLCIYGSVGVLIGFGSAADIIWRNLSAGTETVLSAGERAFHLTAYAGYAIWDDARTASRPTVLRQVHGGGIDIRRIDHDPIALTVADAYAYIITRQAIYRYAGRVREIMINNPAYTVGGSQPAQIPGMEWSGEYEPFYQQGVYSERDDYRIFAGFGGRIFSWLAGGVQEYNPAGDRAGWKSTGLNGRRCFGGTVAAGYLVVSIESEDGDNELWAYDGTGWWCIDRQAMPAPGATGTWCNPLPLGSGFSSNSVGAYNNVMVMVDGTNDYRTYRLADQWHSDGTYLTSYPTSGQAITSMLDAGERDKTKAWRKLGCVFASPVRVGNTTSTDSVDVALDYSIDAGASWISVQSTSKVGNTLPNMNFVMESTLSGITSRFIMLRIRWSSVVDWAPILSSMWVEYEVLDNPARRRKWNLRLLARDQEVDRDGARLAKTGRQLTEDLWQAWESDTPMTFRDIDYDTDPVTRTVRIVGISEAVNQPADSNRWGQSTITLNLVEV